MPKSAWTTYRRDGVAFEYPEGWQVEETPSDDGLAISLHSPDLSFAIVGLFDSFFSPDDLIETTAESIRDEHPDAEFEEIDTEGDEAAAEMVFMTMDTVTYCWMRAWPVGDYTVLAMVQTPDREKTGAQKVFAHLCSTLEEADSTTEEAD